MKRKIGLIVILVLEVVAAVLYFIKNIWNAIIKAIPFMETLAAFAKSIILTVESWLNFDFYNNLPSRAKGIIALLLINLAFVIVYEIFFGIIALVQKRYRRKKLIQNNKKIYTLSEEEKARFEWKLYERHFPTKRLLSLIVPIAFVTCCIVIRFDRTLCINNDTTGNLGYFDVFNNVLPYIDGFGEWLTSVFVKYIHMNNRIVDAIKVTWVEWIEITVAFILIVIIWWGFFSIFAKTYRRHHAKRRANKAKEQYVVRMEYIEYKALKKAEKEKKVSEKNKSLYDEDAYINDANIEVGAISKPVNADNNNDRLKTNSSIEEKNYIDDIATGVTDLGVIEEDNSEIREPISVRETHFVGDEEVDIVLEEEPVIETIEEEESYYNDIEEEKEESFERYQPENTTSLDIDDKIKKYNIDVIDEDTIEVQHFEDNAAPVIQEYEDREDLYVQNNVESKVEQEEKHDESVTDQIDDANKESEVESNTEDSVEDVKEENVNEEKTEETILETNDESITKSIEETTEDQTIEESVVEEHITDNEIEPVIEESLENTIEEPTDDKSEEAATEIENNQNTIAEPLNDALEMTEDQTIEENAVEQQVIVNELEPVVEENEEHLENDVETSKAPDVKIENEPSKAFKPINNKKDLSKKPSKPIDISNDRSKIVEYILKTSKVTLDEEIVAKPTVVETEEKPLEESKIIKPLHKIDEKKKNIKPIAPMDVKRK